MTASTQPHLFVTGASGQLGRLTIAALLRTVPAARIVAGVRDPDGDAARALQAQGVAVRVADYARPETLKAAFAGIDRLLLISSNEIGQRVGQHRNVIAAAQQAGIGLIAYTSLLRADATPLALGTEHVETEALLATSGLPAIVLRNGWYTENYTASIPPALAHGAFLGAAGDGRISLAARVDYAEAAAAVLSAAEPEAGRIYELAGDDACTLTDFAAWIAAASGRPVTYQDLPEAAFEEALIGAGLPEVMADLLADSDAGAAEGGLLEEGRQLSALIGRPTTPVPATIAAALKG